MSWGDPPLIRDDEDEAALKARFVQLCAKYPDRSPQEVGAYVFSGLVDPGFRGEDAGLKWARDLDIQERIASARRNGGVEVTPDIPDKVTLLAEMLAMARDPKTEAPVREKLYTRILEAEGHIVKQEKREVTKPAAFAWPAINLRAKDFSGEPEPAEP